MALKGGKNSASCIETEGEHAASCTDARHQWLGMSMRYLTIFDAPRERSGGRHSVKPIIARSRGFSSKAQGRVDGVVQNKSKVQQNANKSRRIGSKGQHL